MDRLISGRPVTNAWQLAQMNVATSLYSLDDERMSGFMDRLDEINALAEGTAGFIWRLQSESGNATDIDVGGDPLFIVNMSVWASVESLFEYVYKSDHRKVMGQRRHWFRRPELAYQVLWWVPAEHRPDPAEGLARLELLRDGGPTPEAFTFKNSFSSPVRADTGQDPEPDPYCEGWD